MCAIPTRRAAITLTFARMMAPGFFADSKCGSGIFPSIHRNVIMSILLIKFFHILGAVFFVGNIIVSAVWKVLADRSGDLAVIRYATRTVNRTDLLFTVGGILLLLGAGHAMAPEYGGVAANKWIVWSYVLLIASGMIWALILLPVQISQTRLLNKLGSLDTIPARYWKLATVWAVAGTVASVLPVIAIYLMVAKPV
jgi:uncharacterized membrane protein